MWCVVLYHNVEDLGVSMGGSQLQQINTAVSSAVFLAIRNQVAIHNNESAAEQPWNT